MLLTVMSVIVADNRLAHKQNRGICAILEPVRNSVAPDLIRGLAAFLRPLSQR